MCYMLNNSGWHTLWRSDVSGQLTSAIYIQYNFGRVIIVEVIKQKKKTGDVRKQFTLLKITHAHTQPRKKFAEFYKNNKLNLAVNYTKWSRKR